MLIRKLADMLLQTVDMFFKKTTAVHFILSIDIIHISLHRNLRIDDDLAPLVEMQNQIRPQHISIRILENLTVRILHRRLHIEMDSRYKTL